MYHLSDTFEALRYGGGVVTAATALQALEEFASTQWGLVTTGQAQVLGVSRVVMNRLAADGVVQRVRHGVYALPSAGSDPLQDLHAAWLATDRRRGGEERVLAGPDVVVSHSSAAAVHGLGDIIPMRHEFTSAVRKQSAQDDVRFHRLMMSDADVALVDGLPVTSVSRTVADVASEAIDLDHLASVVRDGLSHSGVAYDNLATALNGSAKRMGFPDGVSLIEACLERAGDPVVIADFLQSPVFERTLKPVLQQLTQQYVSAAMPKAVAEALAEVAQVVRPAEGGLQSNLRFPAGAFKVDVSQLLRDNHARKRQVEPRETSSDDDT
ncbi:type IV toxin-antitoxin system AbiEi family antitoxin domain-containing protein [Kocuria sp.]|uniref:type IV toxin-antitoxin system AbiEi family antitoxin domain-containing protein n=1 Tax=Kocuria sp. TaxID=1871328 RepID=UPI0026DF7618|nr:type IV toxin-antitoxin system AbiEi family antitoxin domain-containing protein [Kocuria sp.]MDO5618204.1 type IV toxin-antitoxin system AbiEi family antitoxin domain-containing protein [Kocuria sp.]